MQPLSGAREKIFPTASGWSTTTSSIFAAVYRSGPKWWCSTGSVGAVGPAIAFARAQTHISVMRRYLTLALFLVVVLGGGTLIGLMTLPGDWYAGLTKPPFNPPNWVFAPAWTLLYVLIAIAGWRTWQRDPRGAAMAVWFFQLALNFTWSPVFFGAHRPGAALVIVIALLAAIIVFIVLRQPRDRIAALLFTPYAAWVTFATLLNGAIVHLN